MRESFDICALSTHVQDLATWIEVGGSVCSVSVYKVKNVYVPSDPMVTRVHILAQCHCVHHSPLVPRSELVS